VLLRWVQPMTKVVGVFVRFSCAASDTWVKERKRLKK
jgi:hypothetical protein